MAKKKIKQPRTRLIENKHINPYRPSQIRSDAERDYLKFKDRLEAGESPSSLPKDFGKKIGVAFLWFMVAVLLMVLITLVL
jgi:hypothetical protein